MTFQVHALNPAIFAPLSDLSDSELVQFRAIWVEADSCPGYPCRISLDDVSIGTKLLLVNFNHHPTDSPYRSSHAVYVNPNACQSHPEPGEMPVSISSRLISWRAYDSNGLMIHADVVAGNLLAAALNTVLEKAEVEYVHLHNAKPGCYAATVTRA